MVTFHCDETRQRRGQTQAFRITGVDPTDQRLDQPLERLAAQTLRSKTVLPEA